MEGELQAPVKVESAQCLNVDPQVLWERMDAHDLSQNETARLASLSPALLSLIMNGLRTPSGTCSGGCTRCCSRRPKRNWWLRWSSR